MTVKIELGNVLSWNLIVRVIGFVMFTAIPIMAVWDMLYRER